MNATRVLLVVDWWEKLAGASLALTAVLRLCTLARLSLAAPSVSASMFVPLPRTGAWPLSSYYETEPIARALAPQRLTTADHWRRVADAAPGRAALVLLVYADFPAECRAAMAQQSGRLECPPSCLARASRWLAAAPADTTRGLARVCVLASELRRGLQRAAPLPSVFATHDAVALLNFRRHDDGRPMLPTRQALALRAAQVRPARAVRAAAAAFLRSSRLRPAAYGAVQMRVNHVAHMAHAQAAGGGAASGGSNCTRRVRACARRLGRAARALAPPSTTVVASDLPTLDAANQDGASHRRHAYMRACLRPSLPALWRWHGAAGLSLSCAAARSAAGSRARGARPPASSAAEACDPGWLGLVDVVLASEASSFVAVEVREPWPSAFLEWIVQLRTLARRPTKLIRC